MVTGTLWVPAYHTGLLGFHHELHLRGRLRAVRTGAFRWRGVFCLPLLLQCGNLFGDRCCVASPGERSRRYVK